MSKTFREVIRDIKPNESYECDIKGVNTIRIDCNEVGTIKITSPFQCKIAPCYEFEKIKSRVPFDIAIEEYYKGKEIESAYSGNKYKIISKTNSKKKCFSQKWLPNDSIDINEIRDDWYISD